MEIPTQVIAVFLVGFVIAALGGMFGFWSRTPRFGGLRQADGYRIAEILVGGAGLLLMVGGTLWVLGNGGFWPQ